MNGRIKRGALLGILATPVLLAFYTMATILFSACGAAGTVSSSAACGTLMSSIGEAQHLDPERAVADIRTVAAVCRRLQSVDAGADAGEVDAGVSP